MELKVIFPLLGNMNFVVFEAMSNKTDEVSSPFQAPRKELISNATRRGAFLTNFQLFGNALKHVFGCSLHQGENGEMKS